MELGFDVEKDTLQSLIKSCLLELNKLKLNLTELQVAQTNENSDLKIQELENHILDKEKELSIIKYKAEEEIAILSKKVEEKESIIKSQENKIYELDFITKSLEEIKQYFAEQLADYKKNELADVNNRLNEAYKNLAEKDAHISTLSRTVDEYKIEMISLEKEAQNKEEILSLKKDLEDRNNEIIIKENELNLLRNQSISKEDYFKLQSELTRKDEKIRRLEEINEFYSEIQSDTQSFNTIEKVPPFRLEKE